MKLKMCIRDSSTGEAWKKYFPTFKECKLWLQEEQAHNDEERQLRQKNSIFCENMTRNEKYLKIRELMETQTQDCNFQNLPLSEKAKQYINETCIYEWHMACKSVFIFLTCYGRFSRDLHQDKVIDKLFSGRAKTYRNFIDYDGEDTQIYMNRPMRAILYKQWKREYAVLEVYRSDEDFEWQLQKLYRCQTEGTGTEFFKLPGLFPLLHTM